MRRMETITSLDLRVELAGDVPAEVYAYAREKITSAVAHAHEPVPFARVRVTRHPDPAMARPVVAQANLDVDGRLVRAQISAPTTREAIDLLQDRLRARLERRARHWEARRGRASGASVRELRYGSRLAPRHGYVARPAEDRRIVRHKAFTLGRCTVDEAAAALSDLDYEFHLFTERGTGQDSLLYRAGPAELRLAQVDPDRGHLAPYEVPLTVTDVRAPLLSTLETVERLAVTGRDWLFFLDADRGRGSVLYRRYDGHYGLITPPPESRDA